MPTDNAVYVTKKILEGKKLSDFKFADELEVEINENESVDLPFRYVVDGDKVVLSEKLVEHLRKRKEF
jgi:ribosome biogenesis SPOUT family RNA methylase Rps3